MKRKFDEDDDPCWSRKRKSEKNSKAHVIDRAAEFLSPFRKPLAQCSISMDETNSIPGSTFHVQQQ